MFFINLYFLMFHVFILVGLKLKGLYVLFCMFAVKNGSKTTLIQSQEAFRQVKWQLCARFAFSFYSDI